MVKPRIKNWPGMCGKGIWPEDPMWILVHALCLGRTCYITLGTRSSVASYMCRL